MLEELFKSINYTIIHSLVPLILTLIVIGCFGKKDLTRQAINLVRWGIIFYTTIRLVTFIINYLVLTISNSAIESLNGPYRAAYSMMFLFATVIPFSLLIRQLAANFWYVLIIAFVMNLGVYFERYVIVVTSLNRDVVNSTDFLEQLLYGFVWDISQGVLLAVVLIGVIQLNRRIKLTSSDKKRFLPFLCMTIALFCCNETTETKNISITKVLTIDTASITIIPFSNSYDWVFENAKQTELSTSEMLMIERLLTDSLNNYNSSQQLIFRENTKKYPLHLSSYIIELEKYQRQYMPVINKFGEKEVWINCFCGQKQEKHSREVLIVEDGGNCYFNLKINLASKTIYEFMVNGES